MAKKQEKVKLSPPWESHMQMLKAFFKGDDRIEVVIGTQEGTQKGTVVGQIRVADADCFIALGQALRQTVKFGNVTLYVVIVPANEEVEAKIGKKLKAGKKLLPLAALKEALKKNPAFSKLKMSRLGDRSICFCVFKPAIIQWYNDNLGNPWKITSCMHECQAENVFADEIGALWCTEPVREEEEGK